MKIYKTTNLINNKIYIGQTIHDNSDYLGSGKYLKYAINKYGRKNFKCEILEICNTKEELNIKEEYWIKKLNSNNHSIGYNIAKGGYGGDTFTNNPNKENTRKKMRNRMKIDNPMFKEVNKEKFKGEKNVSKRPEVRKKISEGLKGKPRPQHVKDILSKTHKGKILSKETKQKIRENSKNSRWIYKNNITKFVNKKIIENYLKDGWKLGRKKI